MDRRTARSLDTESNSSRSSSLLSPSHSKVRSDCNPVEFSAMAIREASVMSVLEASSLFNPVQNIDIDMMLASAILLQPSRFNNSSPVQ